MKTLIRYPIALVLLLLIGYGQLVVQWYGNVTSAKSVHTHQGCDRYLTLKKGEKEDFFIEEEQEREEKEFSVKKAAFPLFIASIQQFTWQQPGFFRNHLSKVQATSSSLSVMQVLRI